MKIPTDRDIIDHHEKLGCNFGDTSPVQVVKRSLLKVVCGWHVGSTAQGILLHHNLVSFSKKGNLKVTERGRESLKEILRNLVGED